MTDASAPMCGANQNPVLDGRQLSVALSGVVMQYLQVIRTAEWTPSEAIESDRTLEAACQYGLGLVRMLAEVQNVAGIGDAESVGLAVALMQACNEAQAAMRAAQARAAGAAGTAPKPGCRWRRGLSRRAREHDAPHDAAAAGPGRQPDTGAGPLRMMNARIASTSRTQR